VSLAAAQIEKVLAEIKEATQGGIINNVRQRTEDSLVLTIRTKDRPLRLLISASRKFPRIHFLSGSPAATVTSPLLQSMRKHVAGGWIAGIRQQPGERVVILKILQRRGSEEERTYKVVAELTGTHSNIVLADQQQKVIACARNFRGRKRTIAPGEIYMAPPAPALPPREREDDLEDAAARLGSYNLAVEEHYEQLEIEYALAAGKRALGKNLRSQKTKAERLVAKLHSKKEAAKAAERIKHEGELLKAHMAEIAKGMSEIRLPDYSGPKGDEIRIELDPRLSPSENLERHFRRYRKLRASAAGIDEQIAAAEERMRQLEELGAKLDEATSLEDVIQLEEQATEEGLVPRKRERPARPKRRDPLAPNRFTSADDLDLLVGRNKLQNDHLVLHLARGNDLWLHAQGAQGSHVVVRVPKGKSVPKETLLDAANLALHFSKMRKPGSGHVAYAQCKHVRKPKGSPPGYFTYSNNKSLYITLDSFRLERIFGTKH